MPRSINRPHIIQALMTTQELSQFNILLKEAEKELNTTFSKGSFIRFIIGEYVSNRVTSNK